MQLAPALPASSAGTDPTWVGLRISTDREFSAPQWATAIVPLGASNALDAVHEAQRLLRDGGFRVAGAEGATTAVAVLRAADSSFSAGAIVERRFGGRLEPVSVRLDDPHFDYAYEREVVGVATAARVDVIERR